MRSSCTRRWDEGRPYLCPVGKFKHRGRILAGLTVTGASPEGHGVAQFTENDQTRTVLVQTAVPGDVVTAEVTGHKKKAWVARLLELESPSPDRIAPPCPHFAPCGGCKWQHWAYPAQLADKTAHVRDALVNLGGLANPEIQPILHGAPYHYRNKVEWSFSALRWLSMEEIAGGTVEERRALGYHAAGFFDKVIDVHECHLHDPRGDALRNRIRTIALQENWPFWDARAQTGLLRGVVFRTSVATGEGLAMFVLAEEREDIVDRFVAQLAPEFPWLTSWYWLVNPKKNDSIADLPARHHSGKPALEETLGGYRFQISPQSFFQPNPRMAEQLYEVARSFLPAEPVDVLYDLYCGAGTIGIFCEQHARKIVGVEYVESSVEDARANAARNGLKHLTFEAGDLAKLLTPDFAARHGRPDAVILDPPRAGCADAVLDRLLELAPATVVYVSCKPATQARDIARLRAKYTVTAIQPVDQFPQTPHVENVVQLTLRTSGKAATLLS